MKLTFKKGLFKVIPSLYKFKDQLKSVPGSRWSPKEKTWTYPSSEESREALQFLGENGLFTIDDTAQEELKEGKAQIRRKKLVKSLKVNGTSSVDVPLKTELFKHQKLGYKIGVTLPRAGLLMEQGTGKTLTALAIAGKRFLSGEITRLLVVAPLSTMLSWTGEIEKFVDYPVEVKDLTRIKGSQRKIKLLEEFGSDNKSLSMALINHQSLWRIYPELKEWEADMIIVDESQRIKSGKSKQSKALHQLGDRTKYKLILSGTPITQGPLDVWSQFRFLDSDVFGKSFYKFRERYAVMGGFKGYEVISFKNQEELASKSHSISYRVRKVDTDIDLPPITHQYLSVTLGKEARAHYKEMKKHFKLLLGTEGSIKAPIVLTQLLRLQQITGGFLRTDDSKKIIQVDKSKLDVLEELMEDMPVDKKVVVFARFIPEVKAIQERLAGLGRKVSTLMGETQDRGTVIKQFTDDPESTVLVAQIQTGGVGINLQVADTAIFYSTNFSYGDYDQAKARIHRIGQKSASVNYIHLVVENTIDERIMKALESKRDVADYLIDELNKVQSF